MHADRKLAMLAHLQSLKIDFQFIEAVVGKALSTEELKIIIDPDVSIPLGHMGCYLSHINIYHRMVAEQQDVALILEDDARLHPSVANLIKNYNQSSSNFDYCFLDSENFNNCGPVFYDKDNKIELCTGFLAHKLSEGPSTAHAYLITLPAAVRRIDHAYPIKSPIDVYDKLPYKNNFYSIVNPKLAWLSEYGMTSDTYERKEEAPLALRALKKSYLYYRVRDFLSLSWLNEKNEIQSAIESGRLPNTGRWARLPRGKVILTD